jgi:hypothetical protein
MAGYFVNGDTCDACNPGSYSAAGASTCTQCDAGSYSGQAAVSCTPCDSDTSSGPGASVCTPCTPGSVSPPVGLILFFSWDLKFILRVRDRRFVRRVRQVHSMMEECVIFVALEAIAQEGQRRVLSVTQTPRLVKVPVDALLVLQALFLDL